jgi:serine/threonine-protein kinase
MELCEGVTLAELLQRRVLSAMEGAYVGVELCRALDYAHRQSVVHRDITPRNVLVDAEGAIRLIDFGIAGSVTLAGQERQVFGSLGHMAPEHLRGGEVGPKSDLFSVGTVLIEAWTGRAPFRRETLEETQAALLEPPPALSLSNSELAPLDGLLRSVVGTDVASRPDGAEDLGRPLRHFLKTADTADVARRLGRTVTQMLAERASRPPPADLGDPDPRAITTSKAGGKTQTFAVHRGFDELTQPLLPTVHASVAAGAAQSKAEPAKAATIRSRPVLLLVGLSIMSALIALSLVSSRDGTSNVGPPRSERRDQPPEPSRVESTERAVPGRAAPGRAGLVLPTAPVASSVTSVVATNSESAEGTGGRPSSQPSGAQNGSELAASAKPAVASGFLTLSAEPPCQVLVDGTARGRTPLRDLSLSAGSHRVEFISDLTDEHLGSSIQLNAGEHARLHADFTAATPRIVVR